MHAHSAADECTEVCPDHNPDAWRCTMCERQLPMLADTKDWPEPLCVECYEDVLAARREYWVQITRERLGAETPPASVSGPAHT